MDFLATIKAPSPVFPNDQNAIVSVAADAPVSQAFQVLIKNNILAAPVFDYTKDKYWYMFSIKDVVNHALRVLDETKFENEEIPAITFITEKDHFRNYKVQDIVGQQDKLLEIGTDVSVDKVVELMVKNNVHRVISLNSDHSLNNIITQSRVVECLVQLFGVSPSLSALGRLTVQDIKLAKMGEMISVREDEKAVEAFRLMSKHNISGLPVVNADGKLVANISESDLRAIQSNAQFLKLLYLPVSEYLDMMRKHRASEPKAPKVRPLVKCELIDSYRSVIDKVAESKVHRCFVVDDNDKLLGVITLHEMLSALVKFSPPAP